MVSSCVGGLLWCWFAVFRVWVTRSGLLLCLCFGWCLIVLSLRLFLDFYGCVCMFALNWLCLVYLMLSCLFVRGYVRSLVFGVCALD